MPRLSFLPTIVREVFGERAFPREPEPDLVMDGEDQVAAYAHAGRIDGVMSAAYLFHSARATQVFQACARVVDLGCGPATQLAQIAQFNPGTEFLGVDMSLEMLDKAEAHVASLGLTNVRFRQGDITDLNFLPDGSVDGVLSTMALHHLPTHEHLKRCFREVSRVLKRDGAVYMADFGRLKNLRSVLFFAYMNAKHQPHLFSLDYERSLRAAFEHADFVSIGGEALPASVSIYGTFLVPFLTILQTGPKPIPSELARRLVTMRKALLPRYRVDLDDMRLFFRLSGMKQDPFRQS